MKNYQIIVLIFLMMGLTGCGPPPNSENATMGLLGAYLIYFISLITFLIYKKRSEEHNKEKSIKTFLQENQIIRYILIGLIIFLICIFIGPILEMISSIFAGEPINFERYIDSYFQEYYLIMFIVSGVATLFFMSISTILYSILLLFIFNKKKIQKYDYLVPGIITLFYFITLLLVVLFFGKGTNPTHSLLIIWLWPQFILSIILNLLQVILSMLIHH